MNDDQAAVLVDKLQVRRIDETVALVCEIAPDQVMELMSTAVPGEPAMVLAAFANLEHATRVQDALGAAVADARAEISRGGQDGRHVEDCSQGKRPDGPDRGATG